MKNILKHLNPFYFKSRDLLVMSYLSLVLSIAAAGFFIFLVFVLYPKVHSAANYQGMDKTKFEQIQDRRFKEYIQRTEELERDFLISQRDALLAFSAPVGGLSLILIIFAFYMRKAYELTKAIPGQTIQSTPLRGANDG